jgi:hypothetical protein
MIKRFLVPVLALAALGLPARASIVEYCSGAGCGGNIQSAFDNAVTVAGYSYEGLETFNVDADLAGSYYTDDTSGIIFESFFGGGASGNLTDTGGVLSTPNGDYSIVITIPATVLAINMQINVTPGLCAKDCAEGETSGFLGFINNDSPTSPWTVTISPTGYGGFTQISSFNAATAGMSQADTPEVGTLLLIGAGLISMRWMKRLPRRLAKPRFFRTPQTASSSI